MNKVAFQGKQRLNLFSALSLDVTLARGTSQHSSFLVPVSVRNIARRICSPSSNMTFCKAGRMQSGYVSALSHFNLN